jgi:transcriptional regulator with XRE-family HTH domain
MARQRVSGAELARMIGRSQNYLARRLRDDVPLSANDIEDICEVLSEDLAELIIAAARAVKT